MQIEADRIVHPPYLKLDFQANNYSAVPTSTNVKLIVPYSGLAILKWLVIVSSGTAPVSFHPPIYTPYVTIGFTIVPDVITFLYVPFNVSVVVTPILPSLLNL